MLISHEKKFIYLKTVKTAGTSVEIFFQQYCLPKQHPCYLMPSEGMHETITDYGIVGYRGPKPFPAHVKFYNHMSASQINELIDSYIWENYFKFCVIRNPFDKLVSLWWFQLPLTLTEEYSQQTLKNFDKIRQDFKNWLFNTKRLGIDRNIYKIDDKICVDSFIRFENIAEEIKKISEKLNIDFDQSKLKHYKGQSRKMKIHFSEYYDNETIQFVNNKFSWEIATFEYKCM